MSQSTVSNQQSESFNNEIDLDRAIDTILSTTDSYNNSYILGFYNTSYLKPSFTYSIIPSLVGIDTTSSSIAFTTSVVKLLKKENI